MGHRKNQFSFAIHTCIGPNKIPRSCTCLMSLNEAWRKESWRGELRGGEEEVIK